MKKRTPIAVLAAVATLALPVCALADGTPPAQGPGDRVARKADRQSDRSDKAFDHGSMLLIEKRRTSPNFPCAE